MFFFNRLPVMLALIATEAGSPEPVIQEEQEGLSNTATPIIHHSTPIRAGETILSIAELLLARGVPELFEKLNIALEIR